MLEHYIALQDRVGLERVVGETLPMLPDVAQRNQLRLSRARVLLAADDRDAAAADILRDVLLEERRHPEALALLAGYYERTGASGDIVDLLEQMFEAACEAGDQNGVAEAALQLGARLEGAEPERAAALYERALGIARGRGDLLRKLLALQGQGKQATPEHAQRMEELLALETGPEAAGLVREIAAIWTELGDAPAVRRVLERGRALAPADAGIAQELERLYRARQSWSLLAELLADRAVRETDAADALAWLLEAATLRQTELADPAGATTLLQLARSRAPENAEVVERLARALVTVGDVSAAVAEVTAALAGPAGAAAADPARRLSLSLLLAELESARGDHRAAVAVLRGVHDLSPDAVAETLAGALQLWRAAAAKAGSPGELRAVTLELADLARRRGDVVTARELVGDVLESSEPDADTMQLAADLAEAEGDVAGAVDATYHLMRLTSGEAQVAAANRLVELAGRANRTPDAMAAIEQLVAGDPGQQALIDLLGHLYEGAGEQRKLAALLYETASRSEDETVRFQLLRRAGGLSLELGDGPMALAALTEAVAIRPRDEETALLTSDAHALMGSLAEAAELLKPFVAAHKGMASPALALLHARLARLAAQAGDQKGELAALARAVDADKKNGEIMAVLVERAEAAGDVDLALKVLRLIVANHVVGPITLPDAFLRQARIAYRKGERDRAIMFAKRAAQDLPKGDPIRSAANELISVIDETTRVE